MVVLISTTTTLLYTALATLLLVHAHVLPAADASCPKSPRSSAVDVSSPGAGAPSLSQADEDLISELRGKCTQEQL